MLSLNFSLSIGSGYLLTPLVKNRGRGHIVNPRPLYGLLLAVTAAEY